MEIPFYKMQGTGNDFIVVDNTQLQLSSEELSRVAQIVCQRKMSVGADALMAVDTPEASGDFRMRFYNADGTEAEMCGNGARCIARYAYETGMAKAAMVIETIAGPVPAWRLDQQVYKVQLNPPTKLAMDLQFDDPRITTIDYVELGDPAIPHLVVAVPGLAKLDLESLKPLAEQLRYWEILPKGANVNFYDILPSGEVLERTYERGVEDFTLACGTGSGSVAYALTKRGLLKADPVVLQVLGGKLEVQVKEDELNLIGATNVVVQGTITDESLSYTR